MSPRRRLLAGLVAGALACGALGGAGRAQPGHELAAAERAIEDLRYEEAQALLDRAWRSGDNGPTALARVYRLQGEVAATLGDEAAARAAFARWLALVPAGRLPSGTSPKIAGTYEAARQALAGRALLVESERSVDGAALELVVLADPLGLVAGARATYKGQDGLVGTVQARTGPRYVLPLPAGGRFEVVVAAVDGFGNRLVELGVDGSLVIDTPAPEAPPPPRPRVAPPPDDTPSPIANPWTGEARRPAWYARPWPYAAAAALAGGVGGVFAWRAAQAQDDLDALNADSEDHPFSEAQAVERRLRRDARWANVGLGVGGALVVTAVVLWIVEPGARDAAPASALRLVPGPGDVGVALEWTP